MKERYLEDFEEGLTFRSQRLRIDADRIKRLAAEFDPQPFHLDGKPPAAPYSEASPRAAGTPRRSR